ncbi:MAG: hypothetical protein QNJ40_20900 [Xanthomonadales bacterium]|nr:hypothetical protein [Xanthomonadales bacterium]
MTVLIIILALAVSHYAGVYMQGIKHRAFHLAFAQVRPALDFPGGLLLVVAVPALLVGGIEWWLWQGETPLLGFLFSTLVFIWAWGSRDLDRDVQAYLGAEEGPDRDAAAEQLLFAYRAPADDEAADNPETPDVVRGVFYQGLIRWFGTMLWFLVGGAGAALAYRVFQVLLCEADNRELLSESQVAFLNRWISLINWPAAVLATLALVVVGDFDRAIGKIRACLSSGRSLLSWDREIYPAVGCVHALDGDDLEDAFSHDYAGELGQVNAAMSLVWRVLVCWLTVIAIIQLTILTSQ